MKNKNILLVDDDPTMAARVEFYLIKLGFKQICTLSNFGDGLKYLEKRIPDIVLLNISSEECTASIDFAAQLRTFDSNTIIIFMSEGMNEAIIEQVKIIKPNAYIPKPVKMDVLMATLAFSCVRMNDADCIENREDVSCLRADGILQRIPLSNIKYIETKHNYSYLYLNGDHKAKVLRLSMKKLLDKLPSEDFIQTHRSYAINLKYSNEITRTGVKVADNIIPISRNRYKAIKSAFQNYS